MIGHIETNLFITASHHTYTNGFITSGIDGGEVYIEGMLIEGVLVDLSEVTAHGTTDIVEEDKHIALTIQYTIDILFRQDDLSAHSKTQARTVRVVSRGSN